MRDDDVVDAHVRETFGLFKGLRSEEEDTQIYRLMYESLLGETYQFLQDNLDLGRQALLIKEITRVRQEESDKHKQGEKIWELIFGFMTAIPDVRLKLEKRLIHFINNEYLEMEEKHGHTNR